MSLLKSFTRKVSHAQVHIDYKGLQALPVQYQSLCVHFYIILFIKVHHCIPLFTMATPNTGHRYVVGGISKICSNKTGIRQLEVGDKRHQGCLLVTYLTPIINIRVDTQHL